MGAFDPTQFSATQLGDGGATPASDVASSSNGGGGGGSGGGSNPPGGGYNPAGPLNMSTNSMQPGRDPRTLLTQRAPESLTPQMIQGRWARTIDLNQFNLTGSTTDHLGWERVSVDRPTILLPLSVLNGVLRACPNMMPAAVGANRSENSVRAWNRGALYLWAPGEWFVKYENAGGSVRLLRVPCEDATLAAALIFDAGCMVYGFTGVTSSAVAGTVTTLAAVNEDRRSLTIQCPTSNTASVYISNSNALVVTPGAQTGFEIVPGGSFALTGALLNTNAVFFASPAASQRAVVYETE